MKNKMVDLQKLVIQTCRSSRFTNTQIADQMGITFSEFNNRLHMKNGTKFFDLPQLEVLQNIAGHPFLADYYAGQFGMLVVKAPEPEVVDRVELFNLQARADAARGRLAQAELDAEEDGVVDKKELKHVCNQVVDYMKYTMTGFIAWAALYGVQADAVDMLTRRDEGYWVAAQCCSPRL